MDFSGPNLRCLSSNWVLRFKITAQLSERPDPQTKIQASLGRREIAQQQWSIASRLNDLAIIHFVYECSRKFIICDKSEFLNSAKNYFKGHVKCPRKAKEVLRRSNFPRQKVLFQKGFGDEYLTRPQLTEAFEMLTSRGALERPRQVVLDEMEKKSVH